MALSDERITYLRVLIGRARTMMQRLGGASDVVEILSPAEIDEYVDFIEHLWDAFSLDMIEELLDEIKALRLDREDSRRYAADSSLAREGAEREAQ